MNPPDPNAYKDWKSYAVALVEWIQQTRDSGGVELPNYKVGTLPSPRGTHGMLVYVLDEVGGAVPAFSENDEWLRVTDRAVVS
jgi:hypothetical protein